MIARRISGIRCVREDLEGSSPQCKVKRPGSLAGPDFEKRIWLIVVRRRRAG